VLAAAAFSFNRGGAETIIYSNATPGLYYIGVKCESLQGAEYGLLADVSLESFAQTDSLGNEILRGFPRLPLSLRNSRHSRRGTRVLRHSGHNAAAPGDLTNTIDYSVWPTCRPR
jgi:hypothetical protein